MNSNLVYAVFATAILFTSCDDTLMQISSSVNEDRKALDVDYTGKRVTEICRERWNLEGQLDVLAGYIEEKKYECDRYKIELSAAQDSLSALSSAKNGMTEEELKRKKIECEASVLSAKTKYEASLRGLEGLEREKSVVISRLESLHNEEMHLN